MGITSVDPAALRAAALRMDTAADIVLVCVKTPDTETAARQLQPHLRSETAVVSLQNGVDNAARLAAVLGPSGARVASAVSPGSRPATPVGDESARAAVRSPRSTRRRRQSAGPAGSSSRDDIAASVASSSVT
jgi:ketopantoate reductase